MKKYSAAVERVEQAEFARGHIGPEENAREARAAATVVLLRPANAGLEVLLLRRPSAARFAAGAYAFPGGTVDPSDEDPLLKPVLRNRPEWPALAAGLRELFEETGILLADHPPTHEVSDKLREDLLARRISFCEVVQRLGLTYRQVRVEYFARWVTPERLARRYDARFFLAEAPAMAVPCLTEEHTAYLWVEPEEAVSRFHSGELPMLFPTWKTLEKMGCYGSVEEAFAALCGKNVVPIQARLVEEGGRVRPVMPGDRGYEEGR